MHATATALRSILAGTQATNYAKRIVRDLSMVSGVQVLVPILLELYFVHFITLTFEYADVR